jgi:hypothetical protein
MALWLVSCQSSPDPASAPTPSPAAPAPDLLGKYRQLTGSWLDSTSSEQYVLYEAWHVANDSTLVGHGYALAGKDTVFVEELRLSVAGDIPIYSARIGSQNQGVWVPFQAETHGPDSLIFENPGHDFPQCISYIRNGNQQWMVSVSGTEKGVPREDRSLLVRR